MQQRFTTAALILIGALFAPFPVMASTWTLFDQQDSAGRIEHSEWDSASLSTNEGESQSANVTWRRYSTTQLSPRPETQEIVKSRINCQDFGISTYYQARALVRKDGLPGMQLGPAIESPPSETPITWPTWESSNGKLIRIVCQVAFPDWKPEFMLAHERECAGRATGICSPDRRDLANSTSLLIYRKHQANSACTAALPPEGKAAFSKLADQAVADVLAEVDRCAGGACQLAAMNWMISSIGSDLERAGLGRKCEAFQQRAAKIDRDRQVIAGSQGVKAYIACAASKAPVLDDGQSAPESVATALYSACLGTFNSAADLLLQHPESRKILENQLSPKLVEIVLQYRAAQRASKKPAPRPEPRRRIQL